MSTTTLTYTVKPVTTLLRPNNGRTATTTNRSVGQTGRGTLKSHHSAPANTASANPMTSTNTCSMNRSKLKVSAALSGSGVGTESRTLPAPVAPTVGQRIR